MTRFDFTKRFSMLRKTVILLDNHDSKSLPDLAAEILTAAL